MFKEDLKEWKAVEREFASKIMKWDVSKIEFSEWKFKDWDVKATFHRLGQDVEKTFEIKHDKKADETGNVWIEYMCNGEPSGIYTSTADYIVYKLGDKFYYADRVKFIIELSKTLKSDVIGGDNDKSQMWLVKKDVFRLLTTEL